MKHYKSTISKTFLSTFSLLYSLIDVSISHLAHFFSFKLSSRFYSYMSSIVHMGSIVFLSIHDVSISVVSFSIYPWFFDIGSIFYYISSIFRCGYYSSFLIIYDDSIWVVSIFIYPWYFDMDPFTYPSISIKHRSFLSIHDVSIWIISFTFIYSWYFDIYGIVHFYLSLIVSFIFMSHCKEIKQTDRYY